MQLDDSKHKVYIYNLDDELSSESEPEDGKLAFLPDIEKHLRSNRIPPSILSNKDGELAGMQLVLYSEPTSLSVPKEQDSVRKAILEARARLREKQRDEIGASTNAKASASAFASAPSNDLIRLNDSTLPSTNGSSPLQPASLHPWTQPIQDDDAMDLD